MVSECTLTEDRYDRQLALKRTGLGVLGASQLYANKGRPYGKVDMFAKVLAYIVAGTALTLGVLSSKKKLISYEINRCNNIINKLSSKSDLTPSQKYKLEKSKVQIAYAKKIYPIHEKYIKKTLDRDEYVKMCKDMQKSYDSNISKLKAKYKK